MRGDKYQGMAFNREFVAEIKTYICKSGRYTSVTEFVREAVREKMDRIDKK